MATGQSINKQKLIKDYINDPFNLVEFENLGNSCYINAVMQMMGTNSYLMKFVDSNTFLQIKTQEEWEKTDYVVSLLRIILQILDCKRLLRLVTLTKNIRLKKGYGLIQHDAHELLVDLFDAMDTETEYKMEIGKGDFKGIYGVNVNGNSLVYDKSMEAWERIMNNKMSVMKFTYSFLEVGGIYCSECKSVFHNYEFANHLSVGIPKIDGRNASVHDCLKEYVSIESLEGNDSYDCGKCKKKTNAYKQNRLFISPNTLVIHLKRFEGMRKNSCEVEMDEELEMKDFNYIAVDRKYRLRSVICHYGGMNGGHYACAVRTGDKWFMQDDDASKEISLNMIKSSAYVLSYERVPEENLQEYDVE